MNRVSLDPVFSEAFRAELVARVDASPAPRPRKHRRWWLAGGAFVGVGMLCTVAAIGGGLLPLPGGQEITVLAAPITEVHSGSATIELGAPPDGVTHVAIEYRCLTPGAFTFSDGTNGTCAEADANSRTGITTGSLPLAPGQHTVTIGADTGARWQLTATYVNQVTTTWGVNGDGNTYGVQNENGVPDLIAVSATNGRIGYAKRTDLNEADGTTAAEHFTTAQEALRWQEENAGRSVSIPVYEEDGTTVVGSFVVEYPE